MVAIRGGKRLENELARLAAAAKEGQGATLRVGFLENATYPDGTSVAAVAAFNEFGVPSHNQPPRPFFRGMVRARSREWPRGIATQLKATNYDIPRTLAITGEAVKGQLKQAINDYVGPPLSPKTIAKKGFDKQLIDSSHMINSVDYDVKKETK